MFALLTLSGAHFSGASTPDMIVTITVFGVADYESDVRFSKFRMADPIWRSKFSKKGKLMLNFGFKGFWGRMITNLKSDFQNSKWRIQHGGQNFQKRQFNAKFRL